MYTLYADEGTASMAPEAVLEEIGAPFTIVRIDRAAPRPADYLALNPLGRIPTLAFDGRAIYESAAICLMLAEAHPDAGLAPPVGDPARPVLHQWMQFLSNTLQAAYRAYYYPHTFTTLASEGAIAAARDAATTRVFDAWGVIEGALARSAPHLVGGTYAIADIYRHLLCTWEPDTERLASQCPNVVAAAAAIAARPAVRRMLERNGMA
jgi:glutathione S-transferase